MLVAFYAPWSDESAALNKELSLVAKTLKRAKANIAGDARPTGAEGAPQVTQLH